MGADTKRAEAVVVSHSIVFGQLLENGKICLGPEHRGSGLKLTLLNKSVSFSEAQLTNLVPDADRRLEEIGEDELKEPREE